MNTAQGARTSRFESLTLPSHGRGAAVEHPAHVTFGMEPLTASVHRTGRPDRMQPGWRSCGADRPGEWPDRGPPT
jgi:hypothetical protein